MLLMMKEKAKTRLGQARTFVVAWEGDVREDGSADCHEFDGVVSLRQETRAIPEITLGVGLMTLSRSK
jgi:hypothetical protein